jgi:hypothetical protein
VVKAAHFNMRRGCPERRLRIGSIAAFHGHWVTHSSASVRGKLRWRGSPGGFALSEIRANLIALVTSPDWHMTMVLHPA